MIFIPLSSGSRGDQVENAELLAAAGAAVCLTGDEAVPEALLAALSPLLASAEARRAMADAAGRMARPDAASAIAAMILERIQKEATT